jgi:hypothetical protein
VIGLDDAASAAIAAKKSVLVFGFTDYDDIFMRRHHLTFCLKANSTGGYFENCSKWNSAD